MVEPVRPAEIQASLKKKAVAQDLRRNMAATKITVGNNGSIRVEGDFEIVDQQGNAFGLAGRTAIGLCRCGQSANKPFCDGSHNAAGFSDTVVARELPPPKPKV